MASSFPSISPRHIRKPTLGPNNHLKLAQKKPHKNQARAHGEEKTQVKAHQTTIKHEKPQKQEKMDKTENPCNGVGQQCHMSQKYRVANRPP